MVHAPRARHVQPRQGAVRAVTIRRRRLPALRQLRHQRDAPRVLQVYRSDHRQGCVRRLPRRRALHPAVLQAHAEHPAQLRRHGGVRPGLPQEPGVHAGAPAGGERFGLPHDVSHYGLFRDGNRRRPGP